MTENMAKRIIICPQCGGKFEENLPKCPYCGSTYIKGAEQEYFEKLEDVREDMGELSGVYVQEMARTLGKKGRLLLMLLGTVLVLAVVLALFFGVKKSREAAGDKQELVWRQENYPVMTKLYEQERYEELLHFCYQAVEEGHHIYLWEHEPFLRSYEAALNIQEILQREQEGEKLEEIDYQMLFGDEWHLIALPHIEGLTEEGRAALEEDRKAAEEDMKSRFKPSSEEYAYFLELAKEHNGVLIHTETDEFIKKWYQEEKQ